jgi:hypothetical protein
MVRWDIIRAQVPLYSLLVVSMVIILGSFSALSLVSIWLGATDLGIPLKLSMVFGTVLFLLYVINEIWVGVRTRQYRDLVLGVFFALVSIYALISLFQPLGRFAMRPLAPADLTNIDFNLKVFASLVSFLTLLMVFDGMLWLGEKTTKYFTFLKERS